MTANNDYHFLTPLHTRPSRGHQAPEPVPPSPIPQEDISELIRLEHWNNRYKRLRTSIWRRLLAGASVEPGRYHVRLEEELKVIFSQKNFRRLYGDEWVAEQQKRIKPEKRRELKIDKGVGHDPPGE